MKRQNGPGEDGSVKPHNPPRRTQPNPTNRVPALGPGPRIGGRARSTGGLTAAAITALAALLGLLALTTAPAFAAGDANQPTCPPATETSPGYQTYLPDCRAYELVTPPYIAGQHPKGPSGQLPPISPDGNRLLLLDYGGFAETENLENNGLEYGALYTLTRTAGAWHTEPLDPPASQYPRREFTDIANPELTRTLWMLTPAAHPGEELSLEEGNGTQATNNAIFATRETGPDAHGVFSPIGPFAAPGHTPSAGYNNEPEIGGVLGADSRLTHILFIVPKAGRQSWPGDATSEGSKALYEYNPESNGEPVLVAVANERTLPEEAALQHDSHVDEAARLLGQCGSRLGDHGHTNDRNAISETAETVYFTVNAADLGPAQDACDPGGEGAGPPVDELYARIDAARTLDISEPALTPARQAECTGECLAQETAPGGSRRSPAYYQGASRDGHTVLFTTSQQLLNTDTDRSSDLYEAQITGGEHPAVTRLTMISHGEGEAGDPTPGAGADVTSAAAISQDARRVYFQSRAVLTAEANGNGEHAQPGQENLYLYDNASGRTSYLATGAQLLQISTDGRYAVLRSTRHIAHTDDTATVAQLFRYDAESGLILRVSIGQHAPGGYPCPQTSQFQEGYDCDGNTAAEPALLACTAFQCRHLEDTGDVGEGELDSPYDASSGLSVAADGTVVFQSTDTLTPGAQPGRETDENIYEYREGNVYLIAPAGEPDQLYEQPRLLGIAEQDAGIFLSSTASLVPQDTDTQSGWYDAQPGGGFPAPAAHVECGGETCRGAPAAGPPLPAPAGSALSAPSPPEPPPVKPAVSQPSPARRLAGALRACRAKHNRRVRSACERAAHRRYPAKASSRPPARRGGGR